MSKKHIILCIIINRTDLIYYTNLIYTCDILNNDIVKWGDGDFFFYNSVTDTVLWSS